MRVTKRIDRRSERRDHILAAAGELFAERGPEAVSVAEVAEAAGVSRATVFNHFGSKHALLEGLTEEVLRAYNSFLENALAAGDTPVPVLVRAIFEIVARAVEEQRRFHRAVFREIAKLSLGLDEGGPGQLARQAALTSLIELLERGQARGELGARYRAADLATAFDSLVFGTITHWLYDDETESLTARMLRAADVLLGPIATQPDVPWDRPPPDLTRPIPTWGEHRGRGEVGSTAPRKARA